MCGICGVALPPASSRRISEDLIRRMRETLVHRGPDDAGLHVSDRVGLGHRRLSIVDVSEAGRQPMSSADGRYVIVYNGEIFNHPELKPQLERRGCRYRGHSDTETLLHLVTLEGAEAVQSLRGMFAFAVWDNARHELLLVRDRLGIKPLYYHHAPDGALYFASEIKALLAGGAVAPELDVESLPDYLANHATSGDRTLFAGVRRLLPGHLLRWTGGRIDVEQFWDLPHVEVDGRPGTDGERVEELRARLTESVRLRLMSDVPLGAFLSGGIDSAAITALMASLSPDPVRTFSVAFAEREANELAFARLVARRFRTEHHEILITPEQFFEATPRLIWHEDEPLAHPSSVALNFVSRLASRHVKVVLTGEGADELLGGYGRYRTTLVNLRAGTAWERAVPTPIRRTVRRITELLPEGSRAAQRLRRTFLARPATVEDLYLDNFAVFGRAQQQQLLAPRLRALESDPYVVLRAALGSRSGSLLERLLYADVKSYLVELLMKQDQMSMAASIESRVPFLDHPFAEFSAGLPERLKVRGWVTKVALRRAMQNTLPPEILQRSKMGFPVPLGRWWRTGHHDHLIQAVAGGRARERGLFCMETIKRLANEHRQGRRDHAQRLWALYTLEWWHRIFIDAESPPALPGGPGLS